MKGLKSLFLTLILCITLAGCNNSPPEASPDSYDLPNNTEAPYSETVVVETDSQNSTTPTLPEGALTSEEAISIALKKAQLEKSDIIGLWAELDYDNGVLIYEIDFSNGKYDYDCDIDANTGEIISFEKEIDD